MVAESMVMSVQLRGGTTRAADCVRNGTTCGNVNLKLLTPINASSVQLACYYDEVSRSCQAVATFSAVSIPFASDATVEFDFGGSIFASTIDISLTSSTGLVGEGSRLQLTEAPSAPKEVFRGFPATSVQVLTLPTQVITVDNIIRQNQITREGYHIQAKGDVAGNSVSPEKVGQFLGVPVQFTISNSDSVLVISQLPQATVVVVLSQLLGAISGIGGLLITAMTVYDGYFIGRRHAKLRAELDEQHTHVNYCKANNHSSRLEEAFDGDAVAVNIADNVTYAGGVKNMKKKKSGDDDLEEELVEKTN